MNKIKKEDEMLEFLGGLAVGAFILIIYAVIVSGIKCDLEMEIVRLKRELKILKGGEDD